MIKVRFPIKPEAHSDSTMFTKQGIAYSPKGKKEYQSRLLDSAQVMGWDGSPIDWPVAALWVFSTARPKYLIRKKELNDKVIWNPTKPDTDGFLKCVKDVLQVGPLSKKSKSRNGLGLLTNDSRICLEVVQKVHPPLGYKEEILLFLIPLGDKTNAIVNILEILNDQHRPH